MPCTVTLCPGSITINGCAEEPAGNWVDVGGAVWEAAVVDGWLVETLGETGTRDVAGAADVDPVSAEVTGDEDETCRCFAFPDVAPPKLQLAIARVEQSATTVREFLRTR